MSYRITRHSSTAALIESISTLRDAHRIHALLLTQGLLTDPLVLSNFIAALTLPHKPPHHLHYSQNVLAHHLPLLIPTTFAFNSLIRAYCKSAAPHHSLHFYSQILRSDSLVPDNYTFTFLVRASAQAASPAAGRAVHAAALKRGFGADAYVQSGLIHMYADFGSPDAFRRVYSELRDPDLVSQTAMLGACVECGEIELARELFDGMPHRDPVAWNTLIAGYTHLGRSREALDMFSLMQLENVCITEATMVSVLTACANLGALDQGKWAHAYVQKSRLKITVTLGTALIDMYSKCGCMARAMEVFWGMEEKNVYTWSSAIRGLAMNGAGERCLDLFARMKEERVLPNGVTFVAVLHGCSVAGLVDAGRKHFDSMRNQYCIEPWQEHYGCMVDLYARAGRLDDAVDFINGMPVEPHAGAWGALLSACRIYKNIELGELAMKKIVELESRNHGAYVLLSNIYADSRNWKGVSNVRESMKVKGVKKEPGCSIIEVGGEVHEFFIGDKSHPRYGEIEVMLEEILRRLRLSGYMAKTNEVLFDIEEEEKENALCWHSEKLAIAFGLIALEEGSTIRIVKNLRVCWDCHEATKYISQVFNREIVMRDRNRFHHIKYGVCSCKDYW